MGKDNLLLGTARGKLGDVVFYRTGGEQRFRTRVRPMNPKTNAQLVQRVIVSTSVKAYSPIVGICDHAFQNYNGKLKNQERFMRLNIMKMRPIALSNVKSWSPIQWNLAKIGNWVKKDAVTPVVNPYIVSEGDISTPEYDFINFSNNNFPYILGGVEEVADVANFTYRKFAELLNVNVGDQLTFIWQIAESRVSPNIAKTYVSRIILMPSSGNPDDKMFTYSSADNRLHIVDPNKENYGQTLMLGIKTGEEGETENYLIVTPNNDPVDKNRIASFAMIVSRYENNMWRRSTSEFIVATQYRNLASLEDAIESFLRDQSSSLYLNQSQTEAETTYKNEIQTLNEEVETETKKKSKK